VQAELELSLERIHSRMGGGNDMTITRQSSQAQDTSQGKVLVALDGSPAANLALPIARVFARQLAARLAVVHVAEAPLKQGLIFDVLHLSSKELKDVEVRVLVGTPSEGILEVAGAPDTELIVLTTHGRFVEPGHRLGRVAAAVVAATNRPVLLVRPEAIVGREHLPARIKRMLFPLDGSPVTFGALPPAIDLAGKLHATVDLLYVVSPGQPVPVEPGSISTPHYVDQPQHEWPQWSREATRRLIAEANCPRGVRARAFLGFGDISEAVIRFAGQHQEDIIVLVRRSNFEPGRARVLHQVLKHTPCPIFLLAAQPAGGSG
jgi:nucleotide-binding universal stress UspA family protein